MANIRLYFAIENISLDKEKKDKLVEALKALGANNSAPQPSDRNHWRERLDGDALIFCALFDDRTIAPDAFADYLAKRLGIDKTEVSQAKTQPIYATTASDKISMAYHAVEYLRVLLFGGERGDAKKSNVEVLAYLKANAAAWGEIDSGGKDVGKT
jgi:hypothetical protein